MIDQHKSFVTHIDLGILLGENERMDERGRVVSKDKGVVVRNVEVGEIYMQTACGDKHLKFFNLETLEEETSANKMKDFTYSSYTNTIGFPVQGISGPANGVINSVDRNHV